MPETPIRTFVVDYVTPAGTTLDDFFDDLVELIEGWGCKVEGASDGPYRHA